jgi:hypothetical protein
VEHDVAPGNGAPDGVGITDVGTNDLNAIPSVGRFERATENPYGAASLIQEASDDGAAKESAATGHEDPL